MSPFCYLQKTDDGGRWSKIHFSPYFTEHLRPIAFKMSGGKPVGDIIQERPERNWWLLPFPDPKRRKNIQYYENLYPQPYNLYITCL